MLQIELRKLSDLKPHPDKPRKAVKGGIEKLADSIKGNPEYFNARPIVVSDRTGVLTIIDGERRSEAAAYLGMAEVPTIVMSGLTYEQELEILIKGNTHTGVWDEIKLAAEKWNAAKLKEWNCDAKWKTPAKPVSEDDFDGNTEKITVRCKPGDVWQLGKHRLMCGDSINLDDVKRLMGGAIIDLSFTSPPYNAGASEKLSGNTHFSESKYKGYDDTNDDYLKLIESTTINALSVSKYAFVNLQMLAGNKISIIEFLERLKDDLCDILIWYKKNTQPAMAERVCNSAFEFVFVFSKTNNSRAIGTKQFRGNVSNVYECLPQHKNEFASEHAATFSIDFVSYYISNFSNENENVLDLFGGTGTTMIACEQLNRQCYMMELNPHYCDIIIARWEKYTGQQAVRIEN